MIELLVPYKREADAKGAEDVTVLGQPLSHSATGDHLLGDFIAESIRLATGADIGMHHPGGVRADLKAGAVTYADVYRVMPFDNAVIRVALTGRQLRQVITQAGPLFYYANLHAEFGAPGKQGGRAVTLSAPDGTPVRDEVTYTLATSDFLAEGAHGFTVLAALPRAAVGVTVLDAVIEHLRQLPRPVALPIRRDASEKQSAVMP